MQIVEINSTEPKAFYCPLCGAAIHEELALELEPSMDLDKITKMDKERTFCEHLLFTFDTLAVTSGTSGFGYIAPFLSDVDDADGMIPAPDYIFDHKHMPVGAVCFKILTDGPPGLDNISYVALDMS